MHRINHTIRRIADADVPTVCDIESGDARPATDAELLNFGLIRVADGIYSCVEQLRYDEDADEWAAFGHAPVGQLLTHGIDRFEKLPNDVKGRVLRAVVVCAEDPEGSAVLIAMSTLAEQADAIAKHVGLVEDAPLVDLTTDEALADEATRLAAIPDSGVVRANIPMADVDEDVQVVEARDLAPHSWAGEPKPRGNRR